MGFNLKLATSGVVGVTRLQTGEISVTGPIASDSINILNDGGVIGVDFTVSLPSGPLRGGEVVEFKNLLTQCVNRVSFTTPIVFPTAGVTTGVLVLTDEAGTSVSINVNNTELSYEVPTTIPVYVGTITAVITEDTSGLNVTVPTYVLDYSTRRMTVNNNGHNVDGRDTEIFSETRLQIFRLVYINTNIGWAVI